MDFNPMTLPIHKLQPTALGALAATSLEADGAVTAADAADAAWCPTMEARYGNQLLMHLHMRMNLYALFMFILFR